MSVETEKVRALNMAPMRDEADYVLYWMQANRRVESNQAPAHAADLANQFGLPLLVYEGLTYMYPAANDRIHRYAANRKSGGANRSGVLRISSERAQAAPTISCTG